MPTIRITEDVYEGLQRIATPFVDTPNDVIKRLLEAHFERLNRDLPSQNTLYTQIGRQLTEPLIDEDEEYTEEFRPLTDDDNEYTEGSIRSTSHSSQEPTVSSTWHEDQQGVYEMDATKVTLNDTRHTKVRHARIGNLPVRTGGDWSGLVYAAHKLALQKLGSFQALKRVSIANIIEGRQADSGYKYYPDLGISIQNQDSAASWRSALHIAQHLQIEIESVFEWRDKVGAAFPGKRGRLFWQPGNGSGPKNPPTPPRSSKPGFIL